MVRGDRASAVGGSSVIGLSRPRSDMPSSSSCAPSALPRADAPVLKPTSRGDKGAALATARCEDSRAQALENFMSLMVAPSAAGPQESLLRTWVSFHSAWFGSEVDVLPLTVEKLYAVRSMFRAGGYRSVEAYIARAKDWHLGNGHHWSEHLDRAARKAKRAATRGIGPSRQSAALDLPKVFVTLTGSGTPVSPGGPLGGRSLITCGCFWMMRELEISCARVGHVTVHMEDKAVSWNLPVSKTDVRALGKTRRWECVCGGDLAKPCPFHAVLDQMHLLRGHFGAERFHDELPCFPSAEGSFVDKSSVVSCIEHAAKLIGEPLWDKGGSRRFGGHSLRVSGARFLSSVGD